MLCSRNYHYCDCCRCPVSVLTVYKPPADYCRCDATLQIVREWGLTSSCDTRTDANLRDNYLTMSGSDPNHREVGRQTVSCTTCPPPTTRHPHTHTYTALISSAGHYPARLSARSALIADSLWVILDTRRSRGLTPRQSRAGHPI